MRKYLFAAIMVGVFFWFRRKQQRAAQAEAQAAAVPGQLDFVTANQPTPTAGRKYDDVTIADLEDAYPQALAASIKSLFADPYLNSGQFPVISIHPPVDTVVRDINAMNASDVDKVTALVQWFDTFLSPENLEVYAMLNAPASVLAKAQVINSQRGLYAFDATDHARRILAQ